MAREVPERDILIGWASTSITPDKPVQLAGQFYERVSERVRDPATATAFAVEALEDGGPADGAVIVTTPLLPTAALDGMPT